MPLQAKVYQVSPLAEPGSLATTDYANPINVVPGCRVKTSAAVGGFVWTATAPDGTAVNTLEQFVDGTTTGTTKPLGFVYRLQDVILPCDASATLAINSGRTCPVAVKGAFFAKTLTAATVGQKVFAVTADGTIKTDAAAATVAGAVETDFVVKTAGAAGDLIIIENR